MPELIDIVNQQGIELINGIRANLGATGTNATMRTSQSLRIEVKQEGTKIKMQLFGRPFFMSIETGRQPTKEGATKSDPNLFEAIKEWMEAKGIAGSPWGITKSIHEKGTKLYRQGGRTDIVQPAVDNFVNDVSLALLDNAATEFQIKIREMKW